MNTRRLAVGLIGAVAAFSIARSAPAEPVAVQDIGTESPINCSFSQYDYCQSEASLNGPTVFAPISDPPQNTTVHFSYRGGGNSNYLTWPSNFKASSANGVSHSPQLAQYVQAFATGPWDQDFFFDGTNYIAETPGEIAASASSWNWVFTNYLVSDVIAHGFIQTPVINNNATVYFVTSYMWVPTLTASVTLTIAASALYSGLLDLVEDGNGGHQVTFVAPTGISLFWATATGNQPSLNTAAGAHNVFLFYAINPTSILGVPVGASLPLAGSVNIVGSQLATGECTSATARIPGAALGDAVQVTPSADPNGSSNSGNFFWEGLVTAPSSVVVKLCATVAGTSLTEAYNLRVLQ